MQSANRYHPALVTMHWLIALLIFVNLYLGIVVFENRGGGPGDFQAINPLDLQQLFPISRVRLPNKADL